MDFMTVYEMNTKDYIQYEPNIQKIYIQEDVWDFHIFRIFEEMDGSFTLEMDNIDKELVAEKLNINSYHDVRGIFKEIMAKKVCQAVIDVDCNRGFETYDSETFSTLDEAIECVSEDDNSLIYDLS